MEVLKSTWANPPMGVQCAAPSVLLNTPPKPPAYTVAGAVGSTAIAATNSVNPVPAATQFPPPSVLLKSPELVAAYKVVGVVGSMAAAATFTAMPRPALIAVQL